MYDPQKYFDFMLCKIKTFHVQQAIYPVYSSVIIKHEISYSALKLDVLS